MFLAPIYRAEDAPAVMRGWRDFMASAPDEIGGTLAEFSTIPADPEYPKDAWGAKVMTLAGVWAGPADEGEAAVQPLRVLADPLLDHPWTLHVTQYFLVAMELASPLLLVPGRFGRRAGGHERARGARADKS